MGKKLKLYLNLSLSRIRFIFDVHTSNNNTSNNNRIPFCENVILIYIFKTLKHLIYRKFSRTFQIQNWNLFNKICSFLSIKIVSVCAFSFPCCRSYRSVFGWYALHRFTFVYIHLFSQTNDSGSADVVQNQKASSITINSKGNIGKEGNYLCPKKKK